MPTQLRQGQEYGLFKNMGLLGLSILSMVSSLWYVGSVTFNLLLLRVGVLWKCSLQKLPLQPINLVHWNYNQIALQCLLPGDSSTIVPAKLLKYK